MQNTDIGTVDEQNIEEVTGKRECDDQSIIHYIQLIFNSLPDGVVCTDNERGIIMINPAMESLSGYTQPEILGRKTDFLYSNQEEFERGNVVNSIGNTGKIAEIKEVSFRKKDGTVFDAEIVTTILKSEKNDNVFIIKLIRDISKRKNLEFCLRQQEIKFRTLADFSHNLECWTRVDGSFHYVSPSCKRITGYAAEEFLKNSNLYREIIFPEDKEKFEEHHKNSEQKTGIRELQFRIVRRDGEVRWIEHICQPVFGDGGEFFGFRSSNQDITRRKVHEKNLNKALEEIACCQEQLQAESAYLQEEIKLLLRYENIVGSSNALQYVLFKIEQIAATDTSVLLLGETGTGKELFAWAIHNTSPRKDRPLVKINCAALPPNLIESELFGHEKGSFTGAGFQHTGRFELANKATIFLDEIGELPLELQPKLLRVLQEGEFERVGGSKTLKTDVRVIAATNRDLEDDVKKGLFRKDLWYRLNVFPITAPPLRDRHGDIPQLVMHFVERFSKKFMKKVNVVPKNVMEALENYSWPGNVRELENVVERAIINSSGSKLKLAEELQSSIEESTGGFKTMEEMERSYILKVLKETKWKVSGKNSASEILGLQRSTLRARMSKYNIQKP